MIDGENTQQTQCSRPGNGQMAEVAPHCVHLVRAERELLAECHRQGSHLTVCGELLSVAEMESSYCEPGCERMVTYCTECLYDAARSNADAGLVWSPPAMIVRVDR